MGLLAMFCYLTHLPGPPNINVSNMTFQLWQIDRRLCPQIDPDRDVLFHLYTDFNPVVSQILKQDDDQRLQTSNFDFNKPTVIFFHGFLESYQATDAQSIKNEYMKKGGYNVILVQAQRLLAGPIYFVAVANCKPIGKFAAGFIDYLVAKGLQLRNLHVIGLSLGGQIAGFVGKSVQSGRLPRITALDPAGPSFNANTPDNRISPNDAEFVDVIHSNAGTFGIKYSVGDVDFWPNGGTKQPGCSRFHLAEVYGLFAINWFLFCEHYRAYQLYAKSVNDPTAFPALKCNDYNDYNAGVCRGEVAYIGIAAKSSDSGSYFAKTGTEGTEF